jgi:micrococcal nuclease
MPPQTTVKVNEVIDGDTIVIEGGYRVRYIGIDTPELHPQPEPYAVEAWQANQRLVEGKRVRLERDVSETDRYGRLLCYVYVDSLFVNAELVRQGLARAKAYPPDTRYQDYLEELEQQARLADRGIWAE